MIIQGKTDSFQDHNSNRKAAFSLSSPKKPVNRPQHCMCRLFLTLQ